MTKITIFRNQDQAFLGFDCLGHAGYAEEGEDIVCAGISALVINTINSLGVYTKEKFSTDSDEETGMITLRFDAKRADGQFVKAGNIIYRQRGTKIHPGVNVGIGGDDTLFALTDGILRFERKGRDKKQASVYPVAE